MSAREQRRLLPWEVHCGCPTCGVKPRERCRTLRARYPVPVLRGCRPGRPGEPTSAHKARYELWCWLFGRKACTA